MCSFAGKKPGRETEDLTEHPKHNFKGGKVTWLSTI